nr:hemagglutinin-esterase protein [Grimso virus]
MHFACVAMAPRTLLLVFGLLSGQFGVGFYVVMAQTNSSFNEPLNMVSSVDGDWFLFGDRRSYCINNNDEGMKTYLHLPLDVCKSGLKTRISASPGGSLFKSFHFNDFYNYKGGGKYFIFYEDADFSQRLDFKCTNLGINSIWINNKKRFYRTLYESATRYYYISFVNVTFSGINTTTESLVRADTYSICSKKYTCVSCKPQTEFVFYLNNPVFVGPMSRVTNTRSGPHYNMTNYNLMYNFTLSGCDLYIVPLCAFEGAYRSQGVNYLDSQVYYEYSTGIFHGMNTTVKSAAKTDFDCVYLTLKSGVYASVSPTFYLSIPSRAICLNVTKEFTPVQVVDLPLVYDFSAPVVGHFAITVVNESCYLPFCYFRGANSVGDIANSSTALITGRHILSGLSYNVSCIAKEGVYIYDNVTTVWPSFAFGFCPTAASLVPLVETQIINYTNTVYVNTTCPAVTSKPVTCPTCPSCATCPTCPTGTCPTCPACVVKTCPTCPTCAVCPTSQSKVCPVCPTVDTTPLHVITNLEKVNNQQIVPTSCDPLPVVLLSVLLGISILVTILVLVYFMSEQGERLHQS